jgi:hypothetical protein
MSTEHSFLVQILDHVCRRFQYSSLVFIPAIVGREQVPILHTKVLDRIVRRYFHVMYMFGHFFQGLVGCGQSQQCAAVIETGPIEQYQSGFAKSFNDQSNQEGIYLGSKADRQ